MKNHWIHLYEKKKKRIWTVEFTKNSLFVLRPRRVEVDRNQLASSSGILDIIFKDAMFAINDQELMNFLSDTHHNGLKGQTARLRVYQGLSKELENFELSSLNYSHFTTGSIIDDIKFVFGFNVIRHFQVS